MQQIDCQKVINKNLMDYADKKNLDIAYPNIEYEPDISKQWLKLFYFPLESVDYTFGSYRIRGMAQIDVYVPRNIGTAPAYEIVEDLQNIFKSNSTISSEDGVVRIEEFNFEAIEENNWFRLMCEVYYTSFK